MILRSLKERRAVRESPEGRPEWSAADEHEAAGRLEQAIAVLSEANRARRHPEIERRILKLRHRAGLHRDGAGGEASYPEPDFSRLPADPSVPEVVPDQVTPELLRGAILRNGCLLVRGMVEPEAARRLAGEIERAFDSRAAVAAGKAPRAPGYWEDFEAEPPFDLTEEREWVTDAGGVWAADSPKVMFDVLETFERAGLPELATAYLGERPGITVQKCTLRKVKPDTGTGWHQDGAFLGDVRALNVWLSLTRCGDEAPGMDIVPRRIDHIVPTGTEGAAFDWSVSPAVAEQSAGDAGIVRPIFEPGDVLLFDELFLHSTAAHPEMPNTRYAVESWFFGPSGFPRKYAPLAV